jgi:hypothetical protein
VGRETENINGEGGAGDRVVGLAQGGRRDALRRRQLHVCPLVRSASVDGGPYYARSVGEHVM